MYDEELIVDDNEIIIEQAKQGNYDVIPSQLSNQNTSQLISGLVKVVSALPESAFPVIADMYKQAIISRENIEIENIHTEAEVLRRFNNQIDKALSEIDMTNSKHIENFEKIVRILNDALISEFKSKTKPRGFWGNLFHKR